MVIYKYANTLECLQNCSSLQTYINFCYDMQYRFCLSLFSNMFYYAQIIPVDFFLSIQGFKHTPLFSIIKYYILLFESPQTYLNSTLNPYKFITHTN